MFCAFHEKRIAVEKCGKCGVDICNECQVILKGKMYCRRCVAEPIAGVTLVPFRKPFFAAFLSLVIPGLGQVYNGQPGKGILIFLFSWLIIPWGYGIYEAYSMAEKINRRQIAVLPSLRDFIAFLLVALIMLMFVFRMIIDLFWGGNDVGAVKRNLIEVSQAAEDYKRDKGEYPEKFSELYSGTPPYMQDLYCDVELSGYYYTCNFSKKGYLVTAAFAKKKKEAPGSFSIRTGGVLASQ